MPVYSHPTIIRSRRRTLALSVTPDATIVVKAPLLTPNFVINKFLEEHEEWISSQLEKFQTRSIINRTFVHGEKFPYLGNEYVLTIGSYREITIEDNKLLFPLALKFRIEKELRDWYRNQARETITRLVTTYAVQMETSYSELAFTDTSSQWGSCSADNRLQFCWRLIMAPMLVITYVVVHELAHTLERNHSSSFWNKVRFFNPSYRQQRKWLQENGHLLRISNT